MQIIVVEDNIPTLELLKDILEREGHIIHTAIDGKIALAILQKQSFDLIVSDIHMPHMNGIDLGIQVRQMNISTSILYFSAEINGLATYAKAIEEIGNASFIENKNFSLLIKSIDKYSKESFS